MGAAEFKGFIFGGSRGLLDLRRASAGAAAADEPDESLHPDLRHGIEASFRAFDAVTTTPALRGGGLRFMAKND